jgi:hypothetical protein
VLVDLLALVLFQLAVGLAFFDLVTPARDISGGFFVLHGGIGLAVAALAVYASGRNGFLLRGPSPGASPGVLCLAVLIGLFAHALFARVSAPMPARLFALVAFAAGSILLASRASAAPLGGRGLGPAWMAAGLLLGALFFGSIVWVMNLGHWYLVSKSIPFHLLVRGTEAFALLAALRVAFAVVALGAFAARSPGEAGQAMADLLDPAKDGLFFWSRVLWGLLAPLVLAPFAVKTARMKANQAATGLLYVGLVFVMIGELLGAYLTLRSGLPV